jgi:hypothetical protein
VSTPSLQRCGGKISSYVGPNHRHVLVSRTEIKVIGPVSEGYFCGFSRHRRLGSRAADLRARRVAKFSAWGFFFVQPLRAALLESVPVLSTKLQILCILCELHELQTFILIRGPIFLRHSTVVPFAGKS